MKLLDEVKIIAEAKRFQRMMPHNAFSSVGRKAVISHVASIVDRSILEVCLNDDEKATIFICRILDQSGCLRANAAFAYDAYKKIGSTSKSPPSMPSVKWFRSAINVLMSQGYEPV